MPADHPILLFDGVCNLCNGAVQFIIARDPEAHFRFTALQSATARRLLGGDAPLESIILIEGNRNYRKSTAALRVARRLTFPWPMLYGLWLIPRPVRDGIYDWIAAHRYAWFGRHDSCLLPTPELSKRLLD